MYGLILVGGESTRMGVDKSNLQYHNTPQRIYLYHLLGNFCEQVFVSARKAQIDAWADPLNYLEDNQGSEGPLSGMVTAFEQYPQQNWLIIACDMPGINQEALQYLITHTDPQASVNLFKQVQSVEPEPLMGVWSKNITALLLEYYHKGGRSPLKFLKTINYHLIEVPDHSWLLNVNHPEEYAEFLKNFRQ